MPTPASISDLPGPEAPAEAPPPAEPAFVPYVAATEEMAEFTPKAVILGAVFGIIFGASTVYLALRAGLTVSASIPIAVLSIAVFKRLGKSTILENNIVQTLGSAGESIASGVVFTVPALIFLAGGNAGREEKRLHTKGQCVPESEHTAQHRQALEPVTARVVKRM